MVRLIMQQMTTRTRCTHGRDCGACALLGVTYSGQLRQKQELLEQALQQHPALRDVRPRECLPSPLQSGYRSRAKMAIGLGRRGAVEMGYFRTRSREIVDAPECVVLLPAILRTTHGVRQFLKTSTAVPRTLRHVDIRCGSDPERQHVTLVFRTDAMPRFPFDALRNHVPAVDGISVNLNPTSGPQVIRGAVRHVWGEREVWVDHAGWRLRVSPAAFFQVNLALLPTIHRLMEAFFEGGDALADLYAGVGTHGLALHSRFRRVFFAEGNRSAASDLKATILGSEQGEFTVSPVAVERGLDKLLAAAPDAVVLNPSRVGADPKVLDAIARCPTRKLAYLSCDPETLCRDLAILCSKEFAVRSIQPVDMMPQTRQVEALALLTRR